MVETTAEGSPPPPDRKSRRFKSARFGAAGALLLVVLALLAGLIRYGPMTAPGRRLIEAAFSGQSVGRLGRLRIQGLRGDIWGEFSVARLTIADRDGVWLDARDLAMRWDPGALLDRRVHLRSVSARLVTLSHRPTPTAATPAGRSPVAIDLDDLAMRVELTPGFAQAHGFYRLRASLVQERDNAASGHIHAASEMHAGDFLDAVFRTNRRGGFNVTVDALEARGGALAGAAGMAPNQPFSLTVRAAGDPKAGRFTILTRVGAITPIEASGAWDGAGGSASGEVMLTASSLLDRYARMAGPLARFRIDGRKSTGGLYALTLSLRSDNLAFAAKGEADPTRMATGPRGLAVDLRVADPGRIVATPKMGPAQLTGTITGDQTHWVLAGTDSIEHPGVPQFSLARVSGPLRVEARGGEYAVDAGASGEGGVGQGLLAALLGSRPSATARLSVFRDGRMLVRSFNLAGAGLTVTASGDRSMLGGLSFTGAARLSNLAGGEARGGRDAQGDLDREPGSERVNLGRSVSMRRASGWPLASIHASITCWARRRG